jgi:acetyl-CoA carboxylase biotin carboxyl carrier protein
LLRLGVIDGVVPEPPEGAHSDHVQAAGLLGEALTTALAELLPWAPERLLGARKDRFHRLGVERDVRRRCVVTLGSDKKNHHNLGHSLGHPPIRINNAAPSGRATLESVCRSVSELAKAVPKPPRRIRLQHEQTTVEVEWPSPKTATAAPATARPASAPEPPSGREQQDRLRYVHAPTVGTFYHSPEPGAPPFVSVGDVVRRGQPIGILEVMKMMSPVEADTDGRIVEIIATDAQSVEYQERLIAITPATQADE